MNLAELIEEVYLITNRRDLTAETTSAIKKSTLKAHKTDFYSKDIYEEGIQFPTAAYLQSLDYVSLFSNFRSFKFFKRVEDENDTQGVPIEIVTVDETLDDYGCSKTDIAYVAGRVLEIRSSVEFSKALLGCYVYPIVTDLNYRSWIAEQYPFYIIHEASRLVFSSIGKMEEAAGQRTLAAEELIELKIGATVDVGS